MQILNSTYLLPVKVLGFQQKTHQKVNNYNTDTVSFCAKPKSLATELYKITANDKFFREFVEQVITNPRNSQDTVKMLLDKAGSTEHFLSWYFANDGYREKYSTYINKLVKKAKKPEDLIKISPNWGVWTFQNKFGNDFFIGNTPDDIGSKKDYRNLVTKLLQNKDTGYCIKEFNGGLSGKRAFLVDTGKQKYVLKAQQDYSLYSKALKTALEKDKWLKDTFIKTFKENENMKSDSSYMNAMIDFYLNLHNNPNGAKIHCFDAKTSSVLYDYVEGKEYTGELDINSVDELMPDLRKLGIFYNDIHSGNFKEQNGVLKIIDTGESSFNDILKPTVPYLQIEMPNWSGNSILSVLGAIQLLKS